MRFFKKIGLYLTKSIFSITLLVLPSAFLFTFIFSQPTQVKRIAKEGGVYQALSDTVSGAVTESLEASQQNAVLPKGVIAKASKKAFSASDMEMKGNKLIDEGYAWLNGEKESFSPKIDIESNKVVLADSLAQETGKSIAKKPVCSYEQLQTLQLSNLTEVSSLACQPQGFDINSLKILFTENTAGLQQNNAMFDHVPVLANAQTTQEPAENNALHKISIPAIFQVLKLGFYVVTVMILLCLGLFYALLKDLAKWLLAVAKSLLTAGVLLVVYALIVEWLTRQNILAKLTVGVEGNAAQGIIRPFSEVGTRTNLYFGIGFIIFAVILFVMHRKLKTARIIAETKRQFVPVSTIPPLQTTFDSPQNRENMH